MSSPPSWMRIPGAEQHEMMRCRPGIIPTAAPVTTPDQRCSIPLRFMPHRVRGTALFAIYPAARNNRYKPGMPDRPDARDFRPLLKPGAAVVLPGVSNALAARVVADLGFPAAY